MRPFQCAAGSSLGLALRDRTPPIVGRSGPKMRRAKTKKKAVRRSQCSRQTARSSTAREVILAAGIGELGIAWMGWVRGPRAINTAMEFRFSHRHAHSYRIGNNRPGSSRRPTEMRVRSSAISAAGYTRSARPSRSRVTPGVGRFPQISAQRANPTSKGATLMEKVA